MPLVRDMTASFGVVRGVARQRLRRMPECLAELPGTGVACQASRNRGWLLLVADQDMSPGAGW